LQPDLADWTNTVEEEKTSFVCETFLGILLKIINFPGMPPQVPTKPTAASMVQMKSGSRRDWKLRPFACKSCSLPLGDRVNYVGWGVYGYADEHRGRMAFEGAMARWFRECRARVYMRNGILPYPLPPRKQCA
jgi:hypothetical protein